MAECGKNNTVLCQNYHIYFWQSSLSFIPSCPNVHSTINGKSKKLRKVQMLQLINKVIFFSCFQFLFLQFCTLPKTEHDIWSGECQTSLLPHPTQLKFSMQPCFNLTRRFMPKKLGHLTPSNKTNFNSTQFNSNFNNKSNPI